MPNRSETRLPVTALPTILREQDLPPVGHFVPPSRYAPPIRAISCVYGPRSASCSAEPATTSPLSSRRIIDVCKSVHESRYPSPFDAICVTCPTTCGSGFFRVKVPSWEMSTTVPTGFEKTTIDPCPLEAMEGDPVYPSRSVFGVPSSAPLRSIRAKLTRYESSCSSHTTT